MRPVNIVIKVGTLLLQRRYSNEHALLAISFLKLTNLIVGTAISKCRIIRISPYKDGIKILTPSDRWLPRRD